MRQIILYFNPIRQIEAVQINTSMYSFLQNNFMYTKKTLPEWENWAKNKKKMLVFYENDVLDLTTFARNHPGGNKIIEDYFLKDISPKIFQLHPHDPYRTMNTLMRYKSGILIKGRRFSSEDKQIPLENIKKNEYFDTTTKIKTKPDVIQEKENIEQPQRVQSVLKYSESFQIAEKNSRLLGHEEVMEEEGHSRLIRKFFAKFMPQCSSDKQIIAK